MPMQVKPHRMRYQILGKQTSLPENEKKISDSLECVDSVKSRQSRYYVVVVALGIDEDDDDDEDDEDDDDVTSYVICIKQQTTHQTRTMRWKAS